MSRLGDFSSSVLFVDLNGFTKIKKAFWDDRFGCTKVVKISAEMLEKVIQNTELEKF